MRPEIRLAVLGLSALAVGVTGRPARSVSQQSGAAPSVQLPPSGTAAAAQAAASTEKSADLVRFSFGETHFAIPRRYLAGAPRFPGGDEPAFFRLALTLPDLKPATREDARLLREGHGWGRMLLAWVSYKSPERAGEELLSIKLRGVNPQNYTIDRYGSMLYHLTFPFNTELHVWRKVHSLFFLTCKEKNPFNDPMIPYYPSCRVEERLWDKISVDYAYSKNFLPDTLSIDHQIRALLSSFRTENAPNYKR